MKAIVASFAKADGMKVEAGVVGAKAAMPHPARADITMGEVALINEYGTQGGNIPSRPFLRDTADSKEVQQMVTQTTAALIVKAQYKIPTQEVMHTLGRNLVEAIRHKMDVNDFKPNAQATEDKKGFNHPLTDTGALREAVNYRIIKGKDEYVGKGGGSYDQDKLGDNLTTFDDLDDSQF